MSSERRAAGGKREEAPGERGPAGRVDAANYQVSSESTGPTETGLTSAPAPFVFHAASWEHCTLYGAPSLASLHAMRCVSPGSLALFGDKCLDREQLLYNPTEYYTCITYRDDDIIFK